MSSLTATELKQLLQAELPGALAPERPVAPDAVGRTPARGPKAHGREAPADLLATSDTVIVAERLLEVARYLRDSHGYTFLANSTAVDYLAEQVIEMVYHFQQLDGGPPLVIKTRVPREQAVVPSLTPEWPGAHLQEREAFDLFGVLFTGHPYLRRVYMWDEFEGFPMRKDFPKQGDKYLEEL